MYGLPSFVLIVGSIVILGFWGLVGAAAWKIVSGHFQEPQKCPHCGAELRH
jgi:hypothetical protein